MKFPGKEKATFQIFTNFLLWLTVGGATALLYGIQANSPTAKFPVEAITSFIDLRQFLTVCFAGFVLFGLFALIRHKSVKADDDKRAKYFADLALDEWASAIINFGSLILVCVVLGATKLYLIAVVVCYFFAYYLKPNEQPG